MVVGAGALKQLLVESRGEVGEAGWMREGCCGQS